MAEFLYKVKGDARPNGKPKVYFTCHPEDFEKYFARICDILFQCHNCAVYYTKDMTEPLSDEEIQMTLGSCNLFVIPVTFQLLHTPNRAMDTELAYAKEKHIPVLPLMMEPELNLLFSKPDKFGEMQYVMLSEADETEIPYMEKIDRFVDSVLMNDTLAKRIRSAFRAYIFLSYRKKDRRYANTLMRLIHSLPEFQDVAIWFDEFLTPGESFRENIQKVLESSSLFALLVTPNLLEEPNFIMDVEYPAAKEQGMSILPAQMLPTDQKQLDRKYAGIPQCVDASQVEMLRQKLHDLLAGIADDRDREDPEYLYLIGRAYVDGVDMEIDHQAGMRLIIRAAEAELPEAMSRLYSVYFNGIGEPLDKEKALYWATKLYEYYERQYGQEDERCLQWLNKMAVAYESAGKYRQAYDIQQQAYALYCKVYGEENPQTLLILNNMALFCLDCSDYKKAYELAKKAYTIRKKVLGPKHVDTVSSMAALARAAGELGDYQTELKLTEPIVTYRKRVLGNTHVHTLISMHNLASAYKSLGQLKNAEEQIDQTLAICEKALGPEHERTLSSLLLKAELCGMQDRYEEALALQNRVYEARARLLGEKHPLTMIALGNIAVVYYKMGDYAKSTQIHEKLYALRCEVLGPEHKTTLQGLGNLAVIYSEADQPEKALEIQKRLAAGYEEQMKQGNTKVLLQVNNLCATLARLGDYRSALKLALQVNETYTKAGMEDNLVNLYCMNNISVFYYGLGDIANSTSMAYKAQTAQAKCLDKMNSLRTLTISQFLFAAMHIAPKPEYCDNMRKCVAIMLKIKGENHILALGVWLNYARMLYLSGDYENAKRYAGAAYARLKEHHGQDNEFTNMALSWYALSIRDPKEFGQAVNYSRHAYETNKKRFGQKHVYTTALKSNYAACLANAGQLPQAIEEATAALAIQCEPDQQDNYHSLLTRLRLLQMYKKADMIQQVKQLAPTAVQGCLRVLGRKHAWTQEAEALAQQVSE